MMANQDGVYRRQTLFDPSQNYNQMGRSIQQMIDKDVTRINGQSSHRFLLTLKAKVERQEVANAFHVLRSNQNDDQIDREQLIGLETQIYL
jgi:hypothetical protein